ncbi:MAG: hypothetical protein K2Y37_23090 [Pirellulales bacterium]|nr:hypothetical protein [Pirellulales bacterium]
MLWPVRQAWWCSIVGCWLTILAPRAMPADQVWGATPYRIEIWVAIDPACGDDALFAELSEALATQIDRLIGGAWDARIKPAPAPLLRAALVDLDHLPVESWPKPEATSTAEPVESITNRPPSEQAHTESAAIDKQIVLAVSRASAGWQLAARELDGGSGLQGCTVRRTANDRQGLSEAAFRTLLAAFAPLARIATVEGKAIELDWRASKLPHRDPGLQLMHPGDLLLPVVREFDRAGAVRRVQPLEWTFIRVDDGAGSPNRGTLFSGLRAPLGRRRRGRVEQVAIVVRPSAGSTRLELCSRTQPERPLIGYEVYAHAPDSTETRLLGATDGRGQFLVAARASEPLQILIVKHGQEFLARLPIVPGLFAQQRAPVVDDDLRMAVEGYVVGLQERLVDTIVRRKILLARLRMRIEQGRAGEAQPLMDELRKVETKERLLNELAGRERATVTDDPVSTARIRKLFADTREAIERYLDPNEIDAAERELAAARSGTSPTPPPAGDSAAEPSAPPASTPAAETPAAQPPTTPPPIAPTKAEPAAAGAS